MDGLAIASSTNEVVQLLAALDDSVSTDIGPNALAAVLGALNLVQTLLMAWLAYRYEAHGRERRVTPRRYGQSRG